MTNRDYTAVRKEEYNKTLATAAENPPKAAYGAGFFRLVLLLGSRTTLLPDVLTVVGGHGGLCRSTLLLDVLAVVGKDVGLCRSTLCRR